VGLGVDSGSMSDLIWIDRPSGQTISNVLFNHMTIKSPLAPAPDFYMALAAPTQTGSPTAPASYSLTLTALYGFASSVTLTCSGLPAGASCAAIPGVTPAATGIGVIVNVGVTSSLAAGTYSFSIIGASSAATHSVQAMLVIAGTLTPDFTVGVLTTSQSVLSGTTANYSTNVMSVGGYSSPVTLTCPGLPTGATCVALSVTPTAAGASATVVVTVSTSVAGGTYSFSITGTSGNLSHVQFVTLTVGMVSGSVTPSTTASIAVGASSTFTVLVSPSSGAGGTVNLSCGGLVAGIGCSFSPSSINLTGAPAQSMLTVSVTSMPAAHGGAPNLPMRIRTGKIATVTAYAVLFLMVLAGIATSTREGQRSSRLSRGLAVFAIVLISVTMISCGVVGTTPGPLSKTTTGGGSVASQITVQAQSGTVTTTLATLSITVP
jgi:hypothetical protein